MIQPTRPLRGAVAAAFLTLGLGACHHPVPAPGPGTSQGVPPDLRGSRVMVLPVQQNMGVTGDVDAEMAFGLGQRGHGVEWIFPAQMEQALSRSPGLDADTHGLQMGAFEAGEVRRVGDPLYGQLRRLSAIVDGQVALVPVRASMEPDSLGGSAVRLSAALIQVRTGRVLWFGVAQGDAGPPGDPRALASTVDRLARTVLWYGGA